MDKFKLDNHGVEAIQFLDRVVNDPAFQDFLQTRFPQKYIYEEKLLTNEPFTVEMTPYHNLRKGVKNLKSFTKAENINLAKVY
jgi:hypothetical protein